jgi:hypothetical protein
LSVEITPELIDQVVENLDDPADRRCSWRGLAFMERQKEWIRLFVRTSSPAFPTDPGNRQFE